MSKQYVIIIKILHHPWIKLHEGTATQVIHEATIKQSHDES